MKIFYILLMSKDKQKIQFLPSHTFFFFSDTHAHIYYSFSSQLLLCLCTAYILSRRSDDRQNNVFPSGVHVHIRLKHVISIEIYIREREGDERQTHIHFHSIILQILKGCLFLFPWKFYCNKTCRSYYRRFDDSIIQLEFFF